MHKKQYPVQLSARERTALKTMMKRGAHKARELMRVRVLLAVDAGKTDGEISRELDVGRTTPLEIRKRYCDGGLKRALYDAPRSGQPPKLNGHEQAKVTAIACTTPPEGHGRWTLDLLTEKVHQDVKDDVGRSTIHQVLLRNKTKPWREKNVVHSEDRRRIQRTHDGRLRGV
jgi:transposase